MLFFRSNSILGKKILLTVLLYFEFVDIFFRPINVPRRWNSNRQMEEENEEEDQKEQQQGGQANSPSYINIEFDYLDNKRSSNYGFCQRNPSPETISLDQPNSHASLFKASVSVEDFELNNNNYASPSSSPSSSVVSSSCCHQTRHQTRDQEGQETMACTRSDDEDDDDDEAMSSSYVIEIINGGEHDSIGVDEAIAWAKEKFRTHCSAETTISDQFSDGLKDGNVSVSAPEVGN